MMVQRFVSLEKVVEIGEKLGKGSFGDVHKGRILQTDEAVAVKFIPIEDEAAIEVRIFLLMVLFLIS